MTVRLVPLQSDDSRVGIETPFLARVSPDDSPFSDTGSYFKMQQRAGDPTGFQFFAHDFEGGTLFRWNGSTWVAVARGLAKPPDVHGGQHARSGLDPGVLLANKYVAPTPMVITVNQNAAQSMDSWAGTTMTYELTFVAPGGTLQTPLVTNVWVRLSAYCKVAAGGRMMWSVRTVGDPLGLGTNHEEPYQRITASTNNLRISADFLVALAANMENTVRWMAKMEAVSTSGTIEAGTNDPLYLQAWAA